MATSQQFDTLDGLVVAGPLDMSGNLDISANTLFVNASNKRVGIGTATPATQLEVTGTATLASVDINGGTVDGLTQLSVDNLTLNGSTITNAADATTIQSTNGSIKLDSNLGIIRFLDIGTEFLRITESGQGAVIQTSSSLNNALTLQSDGNAVFAANVALSNGKKIDFGSVMDITASASGATFSANTYHSGHLVHTTTDTDTHIKFNNNEIVLTAGGSAAITANSTVTYAAVELGAPVVRAGDYFEEKVYAGGSISGGGSYTINPANGSVHTITAAGNISVDFTNANIPDDGAITLTLIVTNSGGTREITWPGSAEADAVYWAEGVEPPSSDGIDIYTFYCVNNVIYGALAMRKAGWAS